MIFVGNVLWLVTYFASSSWRFMYRRSVRSCERSSVRLRLDIISHVARGVLSTKTWPTGGMVDPSGWGSLGLDSLCTLSQLRSLSPLTTSELVTLTTDEDVGLEQ